MLTLVGMADAQTDVFTAKARVDQSSFSSLGPRPLIASYAMAPEGKEIAVLVLQGPEIEAPLWLMTKDLATGRVLSSRNLGPSKFPDAGFALQVLYADGNKLLIVQDLRTVRIFDAKSLAVIRTIGSVGDQPPLFVLASSRSGIIVCAFGSPVDASGVHVTPVRLNVINVDTGRVLSDWQADDVPQAISADGNLIAISAAQVEDGILPLNIFDKEGKPVTRLTGGFAFRKPVNLNSPAGRVRGIFVGDRRVLLSPDDNVDQSGHHSGDDLKLVNLANRQVEQEIKPRHYGPTGEITISGDQSKVLVVSWYIPADVYRNPEKRFPKNSTPSALVFKLGTGLGLDAEIPISGSGLNLSGWLEARRPQFSFDGSEVAFAKDNGVSVQSIDHSSLRHPE